MIAPRPWVCVGGSPPCGTITTGVFGSVGEFGGSFGGRSEAPDGSPAFEGTLGSDGASDGESGAGSPLLSGEFATPSGREADTTGAADATAGEYIGLVLPGSPVLAGIDAGSLGRDAGLAASVDRVASSGTVVGSAGVGIGAGGVGGSNAAGVNAIGGSNRAKVVKVKPSVQMPVHIDDHVGSRENISMGGTISGSHGGPIVVSIWPLADVLNPKPQVGHSRS